jgi:hypothetical protein
MTQHCLLHSYFKMRISVNHSLGAQPARAYILGEELRALKGCFRRSAYHEGSSTMEWRSHVGC